MSFAVLKKNGKLENMLTGLAGGLVGAGATLLGSAWSTNRNASESRDYLNYSLDKQYNYWKQGKLDNYSLERKSLEKAGYNPILAINGGSASPFSGSASSPSSSASVGDVASSARQGAALANEITEGYKNANDKTKAEIDVLKDGIKRSNKQTDATVKNIEADTKLKESQKTQQDEQNIIQPVNAVFSNPLISGAAGAAGAYAANKVKNSLVKKGVVETMKKAFTGLGSRALGSVGIGLPLLLGSAASVAYGVGSKAYPEYAEKVNKRMRKQISGAGLPVVY